MIPLNQATDAQINAAADALEAAGKGEAMQTASQMADAEWLREFADTAVRSGPEHFRKQLHAIADRIDAAAISGPSGDGDARPNTWDEPIGDARLDELWANAHAGGLVSDADVLSLVVAVRRLREWVKVLEEAIKKLQPCGVRHLNGGDSIWCVATADEVIALRNQLVIADERPALQPAALATEAKP